MSLTNAHGLFIVFVGLQAFVLVLEVDEASSQNRTENWQIN